MYSRGAVRRGDGRRPRRPVSPCASCGASTCRASASRRPAPARAGEVVEPRPEFPLEPVVGAPHPVAQPRATFGGADLYATLAEKAAALGFSLALNHPFVDGNKRVAHAAVETFLVLNGYELAADVDDAERTMFALAAGMLPRERLLAWIEAHLTPLTR
jgi:death on curing protein